MNNLPSNVKVWGERSDVSTFMKAADVFMFNSTWECNPLVLREAASYGLKILSRDLPEYMDMFTPYITPIDDNINETKNSLLSLINDERRYDVEIGQGKKFALDHLNFYKLFIKTIGIQFEMKKKSIEELINLKLKKKMKILKFEGKWRSVLFGAKM